MFVLLGGNRSGPVNYDVSQVITVTVLHAQWAIAHCYIDASSAAIALGLLLSYFPTLTRTKLLTNKCDVRWFQKLWNLNKIDKDIANMKTMTF